MDKLVEEGTVRFIGVSNFSVAQLTEAQAATATARLPMLLHEINMRTWRTPLASGPNGLLADIGAFRKVVADSIPSAFGTDITVRNVAITEAVPA